MDKIDWVKRLKEIESAITWEGNKISRFLTKEEQSRASALVENETNGAFYYRPNRYGFRGEIVQMKLIPWHELYQVLIQLPFCQCEEILLPWEPSLIECFRIDPVRTEKYSQLGYLPVRPYVRKEDQCIAVSVYQYSRFENYDEDGYGGGDVDEYAMAVIDQEGRLVYPFTHCIDVFLSSSQDMPSEEFLPEQERKMILRT